MKTLKELAHEAVEIQDACNSIALVNSLFKVMQNLKELGVNNTGELNKHPVVQLWILKLMHLAEIDNANEYSITCNTLNKLTGENL